MRTGLVAEYVAGPLKLVDDVVEDMGNIIGIRVQVEAVCLGAAPGEVGVDERNVLGVTSTEEMGGSMLGRGAEHSTHSVLQRILD